MHCSCALVLINILTKKETKIFKRPRTNLVKSFQQRGYERRHALVANTGYEGKVDHQSHTHLCTQERHITSRPQQGETMLMNIHEHHRTQTNAT